MQRFLFFLLFATTGTIVSCTYDKVPPENVECGSGIITYETGPKAIMNRSCAYSGCHVTGNSSGDFSTFQGMKTRLDNGKFEKWVIEDRRMPPSDVPQGKPRFLTEEEILILKCWALEDFPEN